MRVFLNKKFFDCNNLIHFYCNNINKVIGNGNGKIYIQTPQGITEFDFLSEKFNALSNQRVEIFYFNKMLFFAEKNILSIYNEATSENLLYFELPNTSSIISSLYKSNDSLFIGTRNDGLYLLIKNKYLKHIIPKANISEIFKDSYNNYWVGSWDNGVFKIQGKQQTNFRCSKDNAQFLSSDFVRCFSEDNLGNVWIGTFNGLNKYNRLTNTFSRYISNDNSGSLSHSSIWSLIKDEQGTIWIGTYFGGVNYFNPEYEIYTQYKPAKIENKGLSFPVVGMMTEDKENNLWICTEGGGLNKYDPKSKTFKWYKHSSISNSISHDNVKALYYDENKGIMWIATHLGGLNKLNIQSGRFTTYLSKEGDSTTLPSNTLSRIIPYKDQLILATHHGVCIFNPKTGISKQLFKNQFKGSLLKAVNDVFIDHKGLLWISCYGLFSYNFTTNKLKKYTANGNKKKYLSSTNITSIYEDSRHNLLICSDETGIDRYRYETDDFENFDMLNNGLLSDCVYNVLESTPGKLLVSTDNGLCLFNIDKKQFVNYSLKTVLPLSTINAMALYKTSDSVVFLGGVDGMISFHEKDLNFPEKPYKILPFKLIVNGEEVLIKDKTKILSTSLTATREITLHANQSTFSIEFTTTNFISANKDEMVYKLDGFSNIWTTIRGQNSITYTNLNPGSYTLIIKPGKKSNLYREFRLNIKVLPPFYKTIWAYLIYILILGLIVNYLNIIYKTRIKLQESIKYEQERIKDIENLNQLKLRFFTNISHEFRTPLTLILGQLEMLLQVRSFAPSVYNKILGIYNNSLQLGELITELLDFRKQEQGQMKILASEDNIVDFLDEIYYLFLEYAKTRDIDFKFIHAVEPLNVWFDTRQMQKVVNNLLSNAFKNTKDGGSISLSVQAVDKEAVIEVKDTGIGIDLADMDKIFDLFYQSERAVNRYNIGTGIGLTLTKNIIELHKGTIEVHSQVGVGTSFIVKLKLDKNHFTPDQITYKKDDLKMFVTKSETDIQPITPDSESSKIKGVKLLIVEDNESLRAMLKNVFEPFYEVITADDGEDGLAKVKEEMPGLVVSDVLMPKLSGIELCKAIKSDVDTCHIPVVLLTARTAIEHNLEGLRIGADDYITKPFNINILITRCNNIINSRKVLQEKFSNQPQAPLQMLATNAMDKEIMDKVTDIIEKYLDDCNFNIDVFAHEMGMARTKLFEKIKAITGQTPIDFISTVRLKKATILLRNNPELNITEISERLGFNTPRYFSKCFKDKYHVIPLVYRKNYLSDNTNLAE